MSIDTFLKYLNSHNSPSLSGPIVHSYNTLDNVIGFKSVSSLRLVILYYWLNLIRGLFTDQYSDYIYLNLFTKM